MTNYAFLNDQLSLHTSIFGLKLWVVLGICVGAAIVIVLFLISLWFTKRNNNSSNHNNSSHNLTIPHVSKEIQEIKIDTSHARSDSNPEAEASEGDRAQAMVVQQKGDESQRIHIEIGKDHRISYPEKGVNGGGGSSHGSGEQCSIYVPEVSHLGWGHWYTLRELEVSTNGFADENVIGEGGYGIVYRGVLRDDTNVAIKNLLNNRYDMSLT